MEAIYYYGFFFFFRLKSFRPNTFLASTELSREEEEELLLELQEEFEGVLNPPMRLNLPRE
jgi:hypothetical protein